MIAIALGKAGFGVTISGRNSSELSDTARSLPEGMAQEVVGDLGDPMMPQRIIDEALGHWGHVDVLVNNAGVAPLRNVKDTDAELITKTMQINTIAPTKLVAGLWNHWAEGSGGCVINISSISGSDPFPGFLAYGMSKAALDGLTRSVHIEGAPAGIRSFGLALGAVETKMLRTIVTEEQFPTSQTLAPEEVASKVLELIDSGADEMRGTTIRFMRE